MNRETAIAYFLKKPGAVEERPFGPDIPVFKVGGKMFGLMNEASKKRPTINLKYPKEDIAVIRSMFEDVIPGYHMNKDHWNTIYLDGSLEDQFITELIDMSYNLVFERLPKKTKNALFLKQM